MERLYVIVDKNLPSIGYKAAQAGHAIAQWLLENPDQTWNNNFLILLEGDLGRLQYQLNNSSTAYTVFREPDLENQITSIALVNCNQMVKKLKLLG